MSFHTNLRRRLLSAFIITLATSLAASADAQSIGLDLDLAVPVGDSSNGFDLGFGGQLRGGFDVGLPAISLTAEAIVDYYSLPVSELDVSAAIMRYGAGVRVGLPVPFVPDLFAHIGYGSVAYDIGPAEFSDGGLTWDLGAAIDLLPVPLIDIGAHVAYKAIVLDESDLTWVSVGVHAGLSF